MVSIIIPTFDRLPLLREAVASVMGQGRDDWELIVVDDGSRDQTVDYIRELKDPRVELISVAHCANPARLRNVGVARARAPWVGFLDSDDVWLPEKLENQLRALEAQSDCGWSYTAWLLIDEMGTELPLEGYEPWTQRSGNIVRDLLIHGASVSCPTVLVRRDLLASVGAFDEALAFCEDYDLWLRLAVRSPVCALPERLSKIRLHLGNNTRSRPEVNQVFVDVYNKFLGSGYADRSLRRICNRQLAFHSAHYARGIWQRGQRARGAMAFMRALRYQPTHRELWAVLFKKVFRALLSTNSNS